MNVSDREESLQAERLRDWIHETPLSRCTAGSDTCDDWDLAYALMRIINGEPPEDRDQEVIDRAVNQLDGRDADGHRELRPWVMPIYCLGLVFLSMLVAGVAFLCYEGARSLL